MNVILLRVSIVTILAGEKKALFTRKKVLGPGWSEEEDATTIRSFDDFIRYFNRFSIFSPHRDLSSITWLCKFLLVSVSLDAVEENFFFVITVLFFLIKFESAYDDQKIMDLLILNQRQDVNKIVSIRYLR